MYKRTVLFSLLCLLLSVLIVGALGASERQIFDMGGETVRISGVFGTVTPFGRDFNLYDPQDPRLISHLERIEEIFNCKIEFGPGTEAMGGGSYGEVLDMIKTGVLSGDVWFDMAMISTAPGQLPVLAMEGLIKPLDDILEPGYWENLPPELKHAEEGFRILGQTYAFPIQGTVWDGPAGLLFRRDVLEEEGLPDPYDLYEAGEWTWEVFEDMLYHLTRDTTGDGEIDQWGARLQYVKNWIASNQAELAETVDGRRQLTIAGPAVLESWEYLQKLTAEELVQWGWHAHPDDVIFWDQYIHQLSNIYARGLDAYGLEGPQLEWSIIPYPMGPNASEYISVEHGWIWGGIIPVTSEKNPRALIEIANAIQMNTLPWIEWEDGEFGSLEAWQEFYWADREEAVWNRESIEMWRWMQKNTRLFPDPLTRQALSEVGWTASATYDVGERILVQMESPSTVMAEIKPQAQSVLDEMIGQ